MVTTICAVVHLYLMVVSRSPRVTAIWTHARTYAHMKLVSLAPSLAHYASGCRWKFITSSSQRHPNVSTHRWSSYEFCVSHSRLRARASSGASVLARSVWHSLTHSHTPTLPHYHSTKLSLSHPLILPSTGPPTIKRPLGRSRTHACTHARENALSHLVSHSLPHSHSHSTTTSRTSPIAQVLVRVEW